jgi:glutamate synthase (NADPH/NADH) large chain
MVELEPILAEDNALEKADHQGGDLEMHGLVDLLHDMTRNDLQRIRTLVEKHLHYTGSNRAREILDDWSTYAGRFIKVMPVDYRRALETMQAAGTRSEVHH